jgi:serine phosphatase RsbU (regulator of sigma subunit)
MPRSKRLITTAALLIQGYAIYSFAVRSLIWPLIWPKGMLLYFCVLLLYAVGYYLMNAMLTSELVRKTQLESDQTAARQIQRTLLPQELPELPGYDVQTFYEPFRDVGGDYFDVITVPHGRTLFAIADVSGKGMAAALLASSIQALVRTIASMDDDPLAVAQRINTHLCRYTPDDRFATAAFVMLTHDSGELLYVNAGHNAPLVLSSGTAIFLEATGPPLGLFRDAKYETNIATIHVGGSLLLFTDGLTDAILGNAPERLRGALASGSGSGIVNLKSLVDPKSREDDITMLLVNRAPASATSCASSA